MTVTGWWSIRPREPSPPQPSSAPLETLFVLSLAASRLSSSGLSSPHPDIITLPLTPDIITLLQHPGPFSLPQVLPMGYVVSARRIADRRMILAGYRLRLPLLLLSALADHAYFVESLKNDAGKTLSTLR